jgi:hypothetical protein
MVIRTEYRSQGYSMGSSDPFPAGFEIRFESLNFQATGNGYLMRITNRDELHPWWSTSQDRFPPHLLLTAQRPHQRTPRALQYLDTGGALDNVRARRGWNNAGPRALRHNATHLPAGRRWHPWGRARLPGHDSPT